MAIFRYKVFKLFNQNSEYEKTPIHTSCVNVNVHCIVWAGQNYQRKSF